MEGKVAALLRHESQIGDPAGITERMVEWGQVGGRAAGLPEGSTAELYRITLIP
jgi:hypothetical protein